MRTDYRYPFTLLLLAALASTGAVAERTRDLGRFVVHYTAIPSGALDERVASTYTIERSANMGMLNVA
ncbi:MAG: DUF4426 domain-containing protein, partial [Gammaproteobacteria bacterium]|nr:DUF4426 domain-containing protein [Gammaproteobacteria bacterium]